MAWIRLEDNYSLHRKTSKFARLMGNPLAEAYLTRLWTWASSCQPDGDLRDMQDADIADAVRFTGDPATLGDALRGAGFLDADGRIHDWDEYQGAVVDKRNRDRARAAEERAKRKIDPPVQPESRDGSATVAGESRDGSATVAGPSRPTVRYGTVRDETKDEEPSSAGADLFGQPAEATTEKPQPAKRSREAEIDRVLTRWRDLHATPKSAIDGKAGEKRRKRVKARLDEGTTADECILALEGALKSPWHMGTDPGGNGVEYRDVETLLRDRSQVEKFIRLAMDPPKPPPVAAPLPKPVTAPRPALWKPEPPPPFDALAEIEGVYAKRRITGTVNHIIWLPEGATWPEGLEVPEGVTVKPRPPREVR